VVLVGSSTRDQQCGVTHTVAASTAVPAAVQDIDAFKASIISGMEGATVEITSFEQKAELEAQVPGTLADFASDAAKTQFRTGVAVALGVDLSAVSELTVTRGRRRRTAEDASGATAGHGRRMLQATGSVSIAYEVVVQDPLTAALIARATEDTTGFAQALAEAVNDSGVMTLDSSQMTVSAPAISTTIEYEVTVQTADAQVAAAIEAQLRDTTLLASALSAATGVTVSASDVVASASSVTTEPIETPAQVGGELSPVPTGSGSSTGLSGNIFIVVGVVVLVLGYVYVTRHCRASSTDSSADDELKADRKTADADASTAAARSGSKLREVPRKDVDGTLLPLTTKDLAFYGRLAARSTSFASPRRRRPVSPPPPGQPDAAERTRTVEAAASGGEIQQQQQQPQQPHQQQQQTQQQRRGARPRGRPVSPEKKPRRPVSPPPAELAQAWRQPSDSRRSLRSAVRVLGAATELSKAASARVGSVSPRRPSRPRSPLDPAPTWLQHAQLSPSRPTSPQPPSRRPKSPPVPPPHPGAKGAADNAV
jgi:hypothetical protein